MKKLIIIIVVILAVAGLLFLGYYLRSQKESAAPPTTTESGNLPTVQLPKTGGSIENPQQTGGLVQNLKLVVDAPSIDYFVDAKNSVAFVQADGQISKITDNKTDVLSASVVNNLLSASFSFDGKKVLTVMGNSFESQTSIFDTASKTWKPLPQNASGPVWSPNNYQIAYFSGASGTSGSVLSLLDAAGPTSAKPKTLLTLHREDMTLNWLSPNQMLVADKTNALWNSSVWSLDIAKKIFSPVIQDQPGLETIWSSSSAPFGLMFSANKNQEGGGLRLVDKAGSPLKQLNFLTLPSKCVFYDKPVVNAPTQPASSTAKANTSSSVPLKTSAPTSGGTPKTQLMLICAVPRDQQRLSIATLPDAYQEKALFTSDDFFAINVNDGSVKTLFSDPAKNLDASNIKIFNQTIFLINRFDKKVYSFPLAP